MLMTLATVAATFAGFALIRCWDCIASGHDARSLAWSLPGMVALAVCAYAIWNG